MTSGIGKFPYVLIDQKDFSYIMNLDEADFDSAEDLKYQMKNFVTLPKYGQERPLMEEPITNNEQVLRQVEQEQSLAESDPIEEGERDTVPLVPSSVSELIPTSMEDAQAKIGQVQETVSTVQSSVEQVQATVKQIQDTTGTAKQAISGGGVNDEGIIIKTKGQSWQSLIKIWYKEVLAVLAGVWGFAQDNWIYIAAALALFAIGAYLYTTSKQRADDEDAQKRRIASDPNRINVTEIEMKDNVSVTGKQV